jgi:hypothetical protein
VRSLADVDVHRVFVAEVGLGPAHGVLLDGDIWASIHALSAVHVLAVVGAAAGQGRAVHAEAREGGGGCSRVVASLGRRVRHGDLLLGVHVVVVHLVDDLGADERLALQLNLNLRFTKTTPQQQKEKEKNSKISNNQKNYIQ